MNPRRLFDLAARLRGWRLSALASLLDAVNYVVFNCVLPSVATVGPGTTFEHRGLGIVLNRRVVIGRDCVIGTHVVLGGRGGGVDGAPVVGNDVYIGTGAKILGPIMIGDGATIGANAVVLQDVPAGATAVGIPARILPPKTFDA